MPARGDRLVYLDIILDFIEFSGQTDTVSTKTINIELVKGKLYENYSSNLQF